MSKKLDRDRIEELIVEENMDDEEVAEELDCNTETIRQIRTGELGVKKDGVWNEINSVRKRTGLFISLLYENPFLMQETLKEFDFFDNQSVRHTYRKLREFGFPIRKKEIINGKTKKLREWMNNSGKVIFFYLEWKEDEIPHNLDEIEEYLENYRS